MTSPGGGGGRKAPSGRGVRVSTMCSPGSSSFMIICLHVTLTVTPVCSDSLFGSNVLLPVKQQRQNQKP